MCWLINACTLTYYRDINVSLYIQITHRSLLWCDVLHILPFSEQIRQNPVWAPSVGCLVSDLRQSPVGRLQSTNHSSRIPARFSYFSLSLSKNVYFFRLSLLSNTPWGMYNASERNLTWHVNNVTFQLWPPGRYACLDARSWMTVVCQWHPEYAELRRR